MIIVERNSIKEENLMKKLTIALLIVCNLLLSGCNKKESFTERSVPTSQSEEKTSVTSTLESSTSPTVMDSTSQDSNSGTLWNSEKARKLNQFVIDWGKTMKQTYREYTPENNVNLYDLQLPKRVLDEDGWQAVVNENPIELAWSEDGQTSGDGYALVAVFSDADTQPEFGKHVYFFTIVSGEPKVLVTSQNQGNPNNYLYFKETDNKELREGFSELVEGSYSRLESSKHTEQANLGTIAYKDLDTADIVQNTAFGMGCSINDDGKTINFVPAMSGMHQTLQLYISGMGATEEFASYSERIKEASIQTAGKPISLWSGDDKLMLTAQSGVITFSL